MRVIPALLLPMAAFAAQYSAKLVVEDGVEVARLADPAREMEVVVIPSAGNTAVEFTIKQTNIIAFPFEGPAEFKRRPAMCCIPFMAPWTNGVRDVLYANGKRRALQPALLKENEGPLRGLVMFAAEWEVVSCAADENGASLVSRLDFGKVSRWMAQFPFAHTITMTYRLAGGALEVETSIENRAPEPMPVGIGFHPYFSLTGAPRPAWTLQIPAGRIMKLAPGGLPTGETAAMDLPNPYRLGNTGLDTVFAALATEQDGRAHFRVTAGQQMLDVAFGPRFHTAVVYAPRGANYINIEPLAGVGNSFELAHKGIYKDLQTIPSGGTWQESFRVTPTGF